ncbi:MAG: glycoside hydrolase family 3 N-terminal domain-containing protein, partial [Ruthenibacterium sp.]
MERYKNATLPVEERIEDLIAQMTLAEKIGQLNQIPLSAHTLEQIESEIRCGNVGSLIYATSALAGDEDQFAGSLAQREECQHIAVEETRLGIPLINGSNIVHGHRTASVIPLGQAASWDDTLVEEFAAISALEATADGIHWTFAPMLDIARDPRWGRVAEGFGEDPYLCGRLGKATVKGFQGENLAQEGRIAACCKHYVGYGAAEGGRDYESVEISEYTLRNIYLPSFHDCVESGAATVMSAFHENNGTPVTCDRHLLTEILKEEFGFDGFVISDWDAVRQLIHQRVAADAKDASRLALNAGVDMDMLSCSYVRHLETLVKEDAVSLATIE